MKIVGTYVALASPMDAEGRVDHRSFERLLDYQAAGGVVGVVVGGTTGESPNLSLEELTALVRRARDHLPTSIQVIAGSGSNSTAKAVELTRQVFEAGADAAMVVTPFYNKPTQRGLECHYEAVADAASGPIVLYNVPSRTACDLAPDTVVTLSRHERICAVKEAVPDMTRMSALRERCPDDFAVLSGDDPTLAEALEHGADGTVSVTGNVAPQHLSDLVRYGRTGEHREARAIDDRLRDVHAAMFVQSNPIAVKWALARLGVIDCAALRLPLTPLDPAYEGHVEDALRKADLL
ncbi:MAG: 4-hydroxy-tetrahydrodipicolinate synthase [Pseudomonadota bacterium]